MSKLNKLITNWPRGAVYTTSYLKKEGYSPSLLAQYRMNNWLTLVGKGAYVKMGDSLDWRGGVEALQKQLGLDIHVGAKTALGLYGIVHYVRESEHIFLFGKPGTRLPTWFKKAKWGSEVHFTTTKLFKSELGIVTHRYDEFSLKVSSRERALFEQLFLVPQYSSFRDSAHLFEGLHSLRGDLLQSLLEECDSIKVRRMFMAIAEELKYPWLKKLDPSEIDFGRGNRLIDRGGTTHPKYQIIVKGDF